MLLPFGATSARAAPILDVTAPLAGSSVSSDMPPVQGLSSDLLDPITVELYAGPAAAGTPLQTLAAGPIGPAGEWSDLPEAPLPDGQYTVVAEQSEGGEAGASEPVTFTVDTVPPAVSIEAPASYTNDPTPTLRGDAGTAPGDLESVLVRLYAGEGTAGTPVAEAAVTPVGESWSYTAPALADGTYTVQVSQRDEAGNEGVQTASFTVDTVAPAVTLEAPPKYTNDVTPTFRGGAGTAPGDLGSVLVRIYEGATGGAVLVEEAVMPTGGSWSYKAPSLANGQYTVQVSQRDEAGNEGVRTGTFTVDTVAPALTLQAPPAYTNKHTLTLTGRLGQAPGDIQAATVTVYTGSTTGGTIAATGAASVSGEDWKYTTPSLHEGTYTVQVGQRDEAGNEGVQTASFTVDTVAPAVTLDAPPKYTNDVTPTFRGAAGMAPGDLPSVLVRIYKGEGASGKALYEEAVTAVGGTWSYTAQALANGSYTVQVSQRDEAGNEGVQTATFKLDSAAPTVSITGVGLVAREGALFAGPDPTFTGLAGKEDAPEVILNLYAGTSAVEAPPLLSIEAPLSDGSWSSGLGAPLPDGTYTVQAEQEGPAGHQPGVSTPLTFTVDADAPAVTLLAPANGATIAGTRIEAAGGAGTAPGDDPEVTVRVFAGSSVGSSPVESGSGAVAEGHWSARLGALSPGTYTAQAEQGDDVGNVGLSAPSTFTVAEPAGPPPPSASFSWFPADPHVGEPVQLASTSSDPTSAIVGYAWDLAGAGQLTPGGQTIDTTFTTPGEHAVALMVTDALGASSTVTESVPVSAQPLTLMQPFPIVRIAGSEGAKRVTIKLLTVQAPAGADITITCRGRGCPTKRLSAVEPTRRGAGAGAVLLAIRRFERQLPAGVVLEIRVGKAGEIGKYTKFVTRPGRLPVRTDSCLAPDGSPMECPAT